MAAVTTAATTTTTNNHPEGLKRDREESGGFLHWELYYQMWFLESASQKSFLLKDSPFQIKTRNRHFLIPFNNGSIFLEENNCSVEMRTRPFDGRAQGPGSAFSIQPDQSTSQSFLRLLPGFHGFLSGNSHHHTHRFKLEKMPLVVPICEESAKQQPRCEGRRAPAKAHS